MLASDSRTPPTSAERLRQQAVALRRAGRSRREIKEILGIGSNATLDRALRGEPPPEWTRRPRAKDDLHARARVLREQGLDYEEIAAALGVSKSSVSLWVRDMPVPARLSYEECRKRSAEGAQRYWAAERPLREARREAVRAAAAAEIGPLTEREILIAGAIAYWCEGAKTKARRRQDRVVFVNSDPIADQVLPQVSGHSRYRPGGPDLSRAYPRNGRCSRRGTVLAEGYSCGSTAVSPYGPQNSQPEDSPYERG